MPRIASVLTGSLGSNCLTNPGIIKKFQNQLNSFESETDRDQYFQVFY